MMLDAPLPGEKPKPMELSPADAEAEGAQFMSAMAALTGGTG